MVPLDHVQEATHRLVRTVDAMTDDEYAAPSLLPGWSRAHVVAHLALNAEALAFCLRGLADGHPVPMYLSPTARDAEIDDLSGAEPSELRHRLLGATSAFARAIPGIPDAAWGTELERTPGGRRFPAEAVTGMREREVEIHHADLDMGYSFDDWPTEFCERVITDMAGRPRKSAFGVRATDLDRTWRLGEGEGPLVSGPASALAWWLTGRPAQGLTSDDELPEVETL